MEYSDPRDFGFRPETVMTALMPYEQFSSKTRRLILGIDMDIASVALAGFESDDSASRAGDGGGAVGRVVVVNVDRRLG